MEALQALLGQANAALQAEGVPQAAAELQAQVAAAQASLAGLRASLSAQLGEGTAGRCCLPCCVLRLLLYLDPPVSAGAGS